MPALEGPYLGVNPLGASGSVLYPAIEVHRQHVLRAGFLPGVAMSEPVISFFHLPEEARVVMEALNLRDLPKLCHVEGPAACDKRAPLGQQIS